MNVGFNLSNKMYQHLQPSGANAAAAAAGSNPPMLEHNPLHMSTQLNLPVASALSERSIYAQRTPVLPAAAVLNPLSANGSRKRPHESDDREAHLHLSNADESNKKARLAAPQQQLLYQIKSSELSSADNPQEKLPQSAIVSKIQTLCRDELCQLINFLSPKEIAQLQRLNKRFNQELNPADQRVFRTQLKQIMFGQEKWESHFGAIGDVPSLPANIKDILKSPCPFWHGKSVGETHMLVLVPATVNGKPLTLKTLRDLVKAPKLGNKTDYKFSGIELLARHGDSSVEASHWVLMTKDTLPCSSNKSHIVQQSLITAGYSVPNFLEAAVCILTNYVCTGAVRCGQAYTWCEKLMNGYRMLVGCFAKDGINFAEINGDRIDHVIGIAPLRKFF